MLLVIDCGNTNTVFAVYADDGDGDALGVWRSSTKGKRTADEYAVWLNQLMVLAGMEMRQISQVIVATVVPSAIFALRSLCRNHLGCEPMVVGEANVSLGAEVRIDRPEEVGADRVVNAVAAHAQYGGPLIVVDFGTATTFDVVEADGAYAGGAIAPGINLSLEALYMAAAQLPRIVIKPPEEEPGRNEPVKVIGKNTRSAMHSGIFWGYVAMIEGMIARIKAEYGEPMKVIATGGLAKLFTSWTDALEIADDDLTLKGLRMIHRRNKG